MHNDKCYAAYSFTKELTVVELPYRVLCSDSIPVTTSEVTVQGVLSIEMYGSEKV